jgi:hypothetical protein
MEKLESIVQRMIDAGEPEENIKAVIQEYSAGKQNPTAPDAVVEEDTASDTESSSDPGSLDLQIDPNKFKVFDPKSINKPNGMGLEEVPVVDNSKTQSNINKISENLKEKEVKEKTKKRASYRSGVSAIINSNTPYQLGLDGGSIEELNSKGLDSKIRELAKNAFYANTDNAGEDLPEGYTDVVEEEIQKAIKKEKEEEAKIDNDQYKSLEDNNLVYTTVNKSIANNFYNDLRPNQKIYSNLKGEISKYENIISTSDNLEVVEEAKLKLTSLKNKEPEAFKAMEKRFDAAPLFDANGERVTKSEFEEVGGNDKSEAYKTVKAKYNTMDKDNLQKQFALWTLDKNDNNRKLNQTVDLKPSDTQLNMWLYNAGYKPNSDGVYSDVKYSDIVGYRGKGLEMYRGEDFKGEQVYTDLPAELKDLYEERVDLSLKQQALKETFVLNQDPGSMKTGIAGGISTFGKEGLVSLVRMFSPEKAEDFKKELPQTRREELDELQKLLGDSGIRLSKEQESAFERDWAMNLTEGLGGFTGDLLQFAALNKVAGAAGITARIAQIGRTNPMQAKLYTLLMEEVKFEAVTRGEAATGEGVFFGAGGMVAGKFIPKFTGNLARYNNIIEKSIGGGAGMAAGSETAAAMHAITDHFLEKKEFKNSINELYGDLDEAAQRIMGNVLMGKALGMAKLNLRDFKSISEVRKIYDKTNSDLFAGKFKGIELEKKKKLLAELDRTLEQADKGFNELDLGSQQAEVAKANAVIKRYNDRRYGEGNKPDQSAFKSAKKIVNNYEANKAIAIHKIKRQERRMLESGVFKNFTGIEILENNKSFESQNNKAQYNPNIKKIQIDISKYHPGTLGQEFGHVMMGTAFANNPEIAGRFKNKIEKLGESLDGQFLNSKGEKISFAEAIKEAYPKKSQRPEEYIMNVVEFLSQPKYKELLLEKGVLNELKRSTLNYANQIGLDYTNKKNFTEGKDLMEFLFSIGKVAEGGSTKAITKKFEAFKNIVIDGKKLLDLNTGKEISPKDIKASKELVVEAETNIERQILKQKKRAKEQEKLGLPLTKEQIAGNKVLQDNIDLQYNKIAIAALGFKLQKSFDAKAMGLKQAQFNDALSFVAQYKDGIIKRWDPNKEGGGKFSTLVYGNIQPKQILFYEQAFGKNAEKTARLSESEKELADTGSTVETQKLIDPVRALAPDKVAVFEKAYETALEKIDLYKQNYATLKDASPATTKELFGKTTKEKREFIKNNAKTLYDILPLAFRRMAEGTKSSTKINPGILEKFYAKAEPGQVTKTGRAGMDVGTRAGLPLQVKLPFEKVSELFNKLLTTEYTSTSKEGRNQATLIKGLQAEIGKAITNSIARRNPNNPENLVQKLADGKSDILASAIMKEANIPTMKALITEKFGGEITIKDLQSIRKNMLNMMEIPGATSFMISSNLSPGGSSVRNLRDGKFVSGKNIDAATLKAIKNKDVLTVKYLTDIKKGLGIEKMPELNNFRVAIKGQKTENLERNLNTRKEHIDGFKTALDILSEMYKIDPKATGLIAYNSNASGASTRNMAQLIGKEKGIKKGKIQEEHVLQHGEFASLLGDYFKKPSSEMASWLAENYIQISLGKGKTSSHTTVDATYGNWKAKSKMHPFLAKKIKQAIAGEISWKEVPSSNIRLYNEFFSLNSNNITQGGITHAKKYNVEVPKRFENVKNVFEKQGELIFKQLKGEITAAQAKKEIDLFTNKIAPSNAKAALKISKGKTKDIKEAIEKVQEIDKVNIEKQKEVFASKDLNTEFNKFLESSTGIGAEKVFSESKGTVRGRKVKKSFGDYIIPVGAEDFAGLLHKTLAKGKQGEKQLEFYKKNLYDPYNLANENITRERTALMNDFRALKQNLTSVPKNLNKMTKGGDFTVEQALRVAVWEKQGMEIPGLSKTDKIELLKEVNSNPELSNFVTELLKTTKGDGYAKPENNWELGTIATDLMSLLNGAKRTKHLEAWKGNVEEIFSKENRYKLEAAYGRDWMQTMGKTLERMKNGSNRKWGGNPTVEKWLDWVNGSVGAIMFLNTRSAALQTISSVNYLNFSDNNPLAAAKAFANQPQFWKDFKEIYNSDYLKDRRGGNKINVNESELALAAEKGGIQGVISLMLNKGFVLTKGADSFAIASGGSAMYRNRLNKYKKEGLSEKEAKEKAFLDFKAITEETQQSSRPDRISEQQASNAGRILLAFANTPMQYNRLIKRNAQDLFEGRGNKAEKISRIAYYSTVQNFIFNALSKALFAVGFGDDDEETVKKYSSIGNGMVDSLLRGSGLTGNAALAVKNVAMDVADRFDRPRPNFQDAAWKALTVSPPIYSKVSKLRGAGYSLGYTTKDNMFDPSLDNPALSAGAQIASATLNLPLDRVLRKAQNIEAAMSDEAEWWQKSALMMGWSEWELGMDDKPKSKKKKNEVNEFGFKTKRLKF